MNTMEWMLTSISKNTQLYSRVNKNGGCVKIQTRPLFLPAEIIIFILWVKTYSLLSESTESECP